MHIRPYQKLIIWQEADRLCRKTYKRTSFMPKEELFGLTSQMRRSAYSIPMNIVEGNAKHSPKDQLRYLDIAEGSLEELHYQILLCKNLHFLHKEIAEELMNDVQKVSFLMQKFKIGVRKKIS